MKTPVQDYYCIVLYQNANYGGYIDKICYGNDIDFVDHSFPGHNDNYSSVRVGKKVKADLFKDAHYVTKLATVTEDQPNFTEQGYNDNISSIKILLKD